MSSLTTTCPASVTAFHVSPYSFLLILPVTVKPAFDCPFGSTTLPPYEIIKRHQGSIDFKSEEAKGSIFCVTLPVNNNN